MEKDLLDIHKQEAAQVKPNDCININVGVLGHVDSGKTSICKLLSEVASTASLDKNPQSQERGITLDLGFSAFLTRVPTRLQQQVKEQYLQFTLVDCPGHASLLRTIIGGAQIIDLMFLVIDINKGIQPQTAECVVIAELFINRIIIVLNKVDMLEDKNAIDTKIAALRKIFSATKFGEMLFLVPFSTKEEPAFHCDKLKYALLDQLELPKRNLEGKFSMLIDHCFKIKGKGTIATGTVISGMIKPGYEVQICQIQQKCKIKSIEMFRKPLQVARQGDRVAMLLTHLEANLIQRDIACTPGSIRKFIHFVLDVNVVAPYIKKRSIKGKSKFHIITGHQTVMGEIRLFEAKQKHLDLAHEYMGINEITAEDYREQRQQKENRTIHYFAILHLEKELFGTLGQKIIGYKFDIEDEKACRIAFHGSIQLIPQENKKIKIYKDKVKVGIIDRIVDNYTIIVKELFNKNTNIEHFVGKEVVTEKGERVGRIEGSFGKSGKIKVMFKEGLDVPELEGTEVRLAYKKWYN